MYVNLNPPAGVMGAHTTDRRAIKTALGYSFYAPALPAITTNLLFPIVVVGMYLQVRGR